MAGCVSKLYLVDTGQVTDLRVVGSGRYSGGPRGRGDPWGCGVLGLGHGLGVAVVRM